MPTDPLMQMGKYTDKNCEEIVLCGILREPLNLMCRLSVCDFERGDFYYDTHQKLYDVCLWLFNGGVIGPMLVDVWQELTKRCDWLNHPSRKDCLMWLVDVWSKDVWFNDIMQWAEVKELDYPLPGLHDWAALAAAAKVRHLAARRRAIYAANELLRDTNSPTGDADYINKRRERLGEEW